MLSLSLSLSIVEIGGECVWRDRGADGMLLLLLKSRCLFIHSFIDLYFGDLASSLCILRIACLDTHMAVLWILGSVRIAELATRT